MRNNDTFKLLSEPLGKYAYIPDCQLQFIEKEIDLINFKFKTRLFILAVINFINTILGWYETPISIGNYSFIYSNTIMGAISIIFFILIIVLLINRGKQISKMDKELKKSVLFNSLGYITVCDNNTNELYENVENIYGISKEDFLKIYHN